MNRIILAALLAAGVALSAQAQTYQDSGGTVVPGVVPIQPGVGPLFTSANPGKISGSFSASLSGFQPTPSYASLSVGADVQPRRIAERNRRCRLQYWDECSLRDDWRRQRHGDDV